MSRPPAEPGVVQLARLAVKELAGHSFRKHSPFFLTILSSQALSNAQRQGAGQRLAIRAGLQASTDAQRHCFSEAIGASSAAVAGSKQRKLSS